ncbi:MAG: GNAT family N-acetyltransferase [Halolamina sp.]|uniref:GNAT family N-acetyltransferase n=1 Tax=Halolamina sp. TaxID=1940283 RepID=UPI002FC3C202
MSDDRPPDCDALFPETIETDRLRLERVDPASPTALEMYEHWRQGAPNIEETTEYVTWGPYSHPKGVAETLDRALGHVEDAEGSMYVVRAAEAGGEFAGTTGLSVNWDCQRGGLGIWLRKPFWGRGYSGERADALLELAFARLDLDSVSVAHLPDNENSKRAITKYIRRHGGRCEGTFRNFVTDEGGTVHHVCNYSVSQREWAKADGTLTAVQFHD